MMNFASPFTYDWHIQICTVKNKHIKIYIKSKDAIKLTQENKTDDANLVKT